MTDAMVEAEGLQKRFGENVVLQDFALTVGQGKVCGLLGPNGAGKSTAIRILATLLAADSGFARIAGHNVATHPGEVRSQIGFTGQTPALDEILSGHENLMMFGRLNHLSRRASRSRADELLARFELTHAASRPVSQYSGGMKRRLDIAASLILSPAVLFLDEPTTGLDPHARNEVWSDVRALVQSGTTVLLTTQYLEEADHLADQVVVIDTGRVIADDTPRNLKKQVGGSRIELVVRRREDLDRAGELLAFVANAAPQIQADNRLISVPAPERFTTLNAAISQLESGGIEIEDAGIGQPTLDDVFLALTSKKRIPA